ncbi:MAG: DUF58 domain-containing protein [Defluviitaleaceae bacterium]|nr:DUF58 domain-containing protein [Defluviitaleaceae bacterium]MCL2239162.1 DUF58 domain-containing protein [Defluviitaleaceae bacterium]
MKFFKRPRVSNWCLYIAIIAVFLSSAWIYGERLLYLGLLVFAAMPVASFVLTFILLRLLKVTQLAPRTVVKSTPAYISLRLHNPTPLFLSHIQCAFHTDDFAVAVEEEEAFALKGLATGEQRISFQIKYRGTYPIGLKALYATDFMGLFRLRRGMNRKTDVVALPRIVDMTHFPLSMNLLTQAHSRFDIKDEDYATLSDIRPYLPTDSIKRVHWKLTAKRNEWLVKNFQSNALNKVTILLDATRMPLRYTEQIVMEDRIIETAMGLGRFCLRKGMPVDFMVGAGSAVSCQNAASFEIIYQIGAQLVFLEKPPYTPHSMLTQCLNDATGYLNTIIMTSRLDSALYERIANGMNNGHFIAVLYFPSAFKDEDSERIFTLLSEGGAPCFKITENTLTEESEEAA